jgi:peptide/nickel transport system ATP-binding protein
MRSTAAFEIHGLTVAYGRHAGARRVVNDVSLTLHEGEILGLAGESGCGKSTTALGCTGFPLPGMAERSGAALLDGMDLLAQPMRILRRQWGRTIAYLPQDATTSLTPGRKIGVQFDEVLSRHLGITGAEARTQVVDILERVGLPEPALVLRRYPFQFSGGQQQRLALAMALVCRPAVLILDEPTTGLDASTQRIISRLIEELVATLGTAALYVSHDLSLLRSIASRIAIMYAGEIVEIGPVGEVAWTPRHPYTAALLAAVPAVENDEEVRAIQGLPPRAVVEDSCPFAPRCDYVEPNCRAAHPSLEPVANHLVRCVRARELGVLSGQRPVRAHRTSAAAGLVLEASQLTCRYDARPEPRVVVDAVDLEVRESEILGIVGESGSGKSTLLRTLIGLHGNASGALRFREVLLPFPLSRRPANVRREIQIVFQNPASSLNPRHTVERILTRPLEVFAPHLRGSERRERVRKLLDSVQLDSELSSRYPRELSGGQQQRVALARALAAEPSVVLCDEVVSALDVSVQANILQLVRQLRDQSGTAFVFVTHDLAVVRSIADRVMVMQNGRVIETASTSQLFSAPSAPYTRELIAASHG